MTSQLQQALHDDNVLVVQDKIGRGSYPHVVYKKALLMEAWACASWIASAHPRKLTSHQWVDLAKNENVSVAPEIVQDVHMFGIDTDKLTVQHANARGWKRSVIAWELAGVRFPMGLYVNLWAIPGVSFRTRQYVVDLGKLHRFEPVEAWLANAIAPTEKERNDVFRQLWDYAILSYDNILLAWLAKRFSRAQQMDYLYSSFAVRSLVLPSVLYRRRQNPAWSLGDFLQQCVTVLFKNIDEFCEYVALYESSRLRHVWSKLEDIDQIPTAWKGFLASGAMCPEPGHEGHRLVMVLRGMYPDDEVARMEQKVISDSAIVFPETNLVDLL